MLRLTPAPYIIAQIIVVKIGAIIFLTSSVANIVISLDAGIRFGEFFVNVGMISFALILVTVVLFLGFFRENLREEPQNVDILLDTSAWIYVGNRALMYKSTVALVVMIIAFIVIPSSILSPDMIALTIAVILLVTSRLKPVEIFRKVDFKLIFYLLGLFVVTGALEKVGVIDLIAAGLGGTSFGSPFGTFLFLFWISAYISAPVDNIAIVRVFIPMTDLITQGYSMAARHLAFYGIAFGVNLGDNIIVASGDSLIGISVAEENQSPVNMRRISLIGFVTANVQLFTIMTIYSLIYWWEFGLVLLIALFAILFVIVMRKKLHAKTKTRKSLPA